MTSLNQTALDEIKRESLVFFSAFFEQKRQNRYIQNMYSDGKCNAETFKRFKSRGNNPTHLLIDDKIVNKNLVVRGYNS